MTYAQLYTAAAATEWQQRVQAALFAACSAIATDQPADGIDKRRDILSRKILMGTAGANFLANFALVVALGFLADADLSEVAVTDVEMDNRVSAIFNDFVAAYWGS